VRIRIADGKKIFKCCLNFFKISIQVLPTVLQPALLCMNFEDSAGNITAGARQIHFIILFSEFFFWFQRDS
jgi:hypothetical protein